MNKVTLTGRLGRDAEIAYTTGGTAVCTLSVVTCDKKKQADGTWKDENTQWHTVKVWGKAAERAGNLRKGGVFVDGDIRYESWEKDGVKHYKTVINSFHVAGLVEPEKTQPAPEAKAPEPVFDESDPLPF